MPGLLDHRDFIRVKVVSGRCNICNEEQRSSGVEKQLGSVRVLHENGREWNVIMEFNKHQFHRQPQLKIHTVNNSKINHKDFDNILEIHIKSKTNVRYSVLDLCTKPED